MCLRYFLGFRRESLGFPLNILHLHVAVGISENQEQLICHNDTRLRRGIENKLYNCHSQSLGRSNFKFIVIKYQLG